MGPWVISMADWALTWVEQPAGSSAASRARWRRCMGSPLFEAEKFTSELSRSLRMEVSVGSREADSAREPRVLAR